MDGDSYNCVDYLRDDAIIRSLRCCSVFKELMMATEKVTAVDNLTKEERMLVVSALVLKRSSVVRASKSETNPDVVRIRAKEADEINNLILKFS